MAEAAAAGATETKPALLPEAPQLQVKVKDAEGSELTFRVRATTPMGKVFDAYCSKKGHARATMRFLFDGNRITDAATPGSLEMEDGDVIDAVVEQIGGGRSSR